MSTFAQTTRRLGVAKFFSRPGEPNIYGSVAGTDPIAIDPRMPYRAGDTKAVWCGPAESQDWARAESARLRLPWIYYLDRHGLTPDMVPAGARAGVYAYPTLWQPPSWTHAHIRRDLVTLSDQGVGCDLIVPGYRGWRNGEYRWSIDDAKAALSIAWDLACEFDVGALWWFAQHRGTAPDGLDYFAELLELYDEMCAASADANHFPTLESSLPILTPTPVPVPAPTETPVKTLIGFSKPLPASIDFVYVGEKVVHDDGSFSFRIVFAPADLFGTGDWLSLDEFGNFHRSTNQAQDERFRPTDQGGYVAAGNRGVTPVKPFFVPMQTWSVPA